ncbi:menaquinone biosynthesis protein [Alistipes sp. OttesenSCG-928-L06]|nr:menaquinone biosynthesis protein [Alistipes sp. OttesenSCG-928-L06]
MTRVKIAAVSYLNTVPFIYGIRHAGNDLRAELLLTPPAQCAENIANGNADIALIPVATIPDIPNIQVIGHHCISANDNVRTVVLMSVSPLDQIKTIYLDPHSRTSVNLVRVLASEHWQLDVEWRPLTDFADVRPEPGVGYTLIGDKVFGYEHLFPYKYDLAHAWHEWTGLSFVFAAWVARADVDPQAVEQLEEALRFGIAHIPEAVAEDQSERERHIPYDTAVGYLTDNIDFVLDRRKRESLELFWQKLRTSYWRANPG